MTAINLSYMFNALYLVNAHNECPNNVSHRSTIRIQVMVYILVHDICSPCVYVLGIYFLWLALGRTLWNTLMLRLQIPCTYSCNHATTITQQSQNQGVQCADIWHSTSPPAAPSPTNPPAAPPPTQPVVYAGIQRSTYPPVAVDAETRTTGQVLKLNVQVCSS